MAFLFGFFPFPHLGEHRCCRVLYVIYPDVAADSALGYRGADVAFIPRSFPADLFASG